MIRQERLFLTKNTLTTFARPLDTLDGIPGEVTRRSVSFFRDDLPQTIQKLRPQRPETWLSEREWIPIIMETASRPRRLMLKSDVHQENIDYLEQTSCEEIFADREMQYQTSYAEFPDVEELCHRHGDAENRKIYTVACED